LSLFIGLAICQLHYHMRVDLLGAHHYVYALAIQKAWRGDDPYLPLGMGWTYLYPPPSLLLFRAVEILTAPSVGPRLAFIGLAGIAAVLCIVVMAGSLRWPRALVCVLLLTSAGVIESTYLGQINGIVILFLAVFFVAWRRNAFPLACAALAVAICLK